MYNADELKRALNEGSLGASSSEVVLVGFVKESARKETILFSDSGAGEWIELPLGMIRQAELLVHKSCCDRTPMPVMKVTLNEPTDDGSKILFALLRSRIAGSRRLGSNALRGFAGTLGIETGGPSLPPPPPPQKCGDCELIWIVCMEIAETADAIQACMDDALQCYDSCI